LATEGASVVVSDRDGEGAFETARTIVRAGGTAVGEQCDVRDFGRIETLVQTAVSTFGRLDIVVGNAGLLRTAPLSETSVADFEDHLALNLTANFVLARAAAPVLMRGRNSSLIFNASLGGLRGTAGSAGYNAAKGGLVNLTRSLADELGPRGVRVNCICPGWVDTSFNDPFWSRLSPGAREAIERRIPLRRQCSPEEVADVVVFLASDDSRYVSGHPLVIDGGLYAT
jgi:NAD(P)-dependent dehydrogenase (short-subunit alcohol dehydrogenase family)